MRTWQAADAQQKFSRLVEAARSEPDALLRHSEPVGVVMSMEHDRALTAQADAAFTSLLLSSPLEENDFDQEVGMSLSDDG